MMDSTTELTCRSQTAPSTAYSGLFWDAISAGNTQQLIGSNLGAMRGKAPKRSLSNGKPKMGQVSQTQIGNSKAAKIQKIQEELRAILPKVLEHTGLAAESNLNAVIGSKAEILIDQWKAVISTPDEYIDHWMNGLRNFIERNPHNRQIRLFKETLSSSEEYQHYVHLFLTRSFYNHERGWNRPRPLPSEAQVWIGPNHADYGLLVSPRFKDGQWENDKSEIRHFKKNYWTLGHVLHTGLVIKDRKEVIEFSSIENFLLHYKNSYVRITGSKYQMEIADLYSDYVMSKENKEDIPILFPELRYGNSEKKHIYRVDYAIFNQSNQRKVGFELSPWSSHGYLSGTKEKSQKEINEDALRNFSRETLRSRRFYLDKDMTILTYTDDQLLNIREIFEDIKIYLESKTVITPHMSFAEHMALLK